MAPGTSVFPSGLWGVVSWRLQGSDQGHSDCCFHPQALLQAPQCPGHEEGLPAPPWPHLACSQQARGSWNLERSLACVCCLPPAGAPPLTQGQTFLLTAPNKPPGKEELWEGVGNRLDVRTVLGVRGRRSLGTSKAGQPVGAEGERSLGFDHSPQPVRLIRSWVQTMAVLEFLYDLCGFPH